MKKLVAIVLTLMLCLACMAPAMADDFTIVVNLKTLSSEYWQTVKSGIDKAADELGITIDVQGPPAESDIQGQVNQIETQLAGAPDAIIIALSCTRIWCGRPVRSSTSRSDVPFSRASVR